MYFTTQVLQTLWTLHASDPLYMLSQSVLAMYSLLNMMKSVVASQNIFLGSSEVYTGTTKTELLIIGSFFMAPMHKLQYFVIL